MCVLKCICASELVGVCAFSWVCVDARASLFISCECLGEYVIRFVRA